MSAVVWSKQPTNTCIYRLFDLAPTPVNIAANKRYLWAHHISIMNVLSWRTVCALTRWLFWCLFPSLLRNLANKHKNNHRESAFKQFVTPTQCPPSRSFVVCSHWGPMTVSGVIAIICLSYRSLLIPHYSDVIMSVMASQITCVSIVCSTACSGADQRKHQSSASLAFVGGFHRWPTDSPHKGPATRKMFPYMTSSWHGVFVGK